MMQGPANEQDLRSRRIQPNLDLRSNEYGKMDETMPDARPLGVNSLAMGLKEKDLANGLSAVFFSAIALRGVASAQDTFKGVSTVVRARALSAKMLQPGDVENPGHRTAHTRQAREQ